ncbi:DUF222 domain-containing protein [Microbispora hainanensis]|uniref:DUF222 domain-containing protein n=1 Tax=Microbispora hainanensis TaxID=568844 RepID=A0ABZ1SLW6_9ACTN|nr:DUF222 domain-containing protein [Microbispora hainanensis]
MAQELALTPLPDDVDMCLAEAEELLFARDRITSALADRVGRVHRAGQARQHGHASTRCWLRTSGGMTVGGAGRLLTLGAELPRLPVVREKFATGELAAGVVEAICAAVAGLTDEQATLAEPILVDLAGKAGAAEVAKAGRHLRAVLDPDGEERDERADYGRRFLRVRPGKGGGVEGEFYLPREAGARLMALLQAYAKLRAQGDDRPLTVRQADALIALLEQKIAAELLVVVSAESLPTDPETTDPTDDNPHPADDTSDPATQDPAAPATQDTDPATQDTADDDVSDHFADLGDSAPSDYVPDPAGCTDEPSQADPATEDPADPAADDDVSDHFADLGDSAPSDYIPDIAGTTDEPGQADDTTDHAEDTRDAADFEESRDDTGDPAPGQADDFDNAEAEADAGAESADDTNAYAPDATGSADDLSRADDTVSGALGDPGAAGGADDPDIPEEFDTGEAEADAGAGSDAGECELRDTASTASAEGDHTVNAASAEGGETVPAKVGDGDRVAAKSGTPHTARRASACPADGDGHAHTAPSDTAPSGATASGATVSDATASDAPLSQAACSEAAPSHTTPSEAAPSEAVWTDPPPEDVSARHTHAGPGPAGDCRRGQSTCRCDGQGAWRCSGEVRCSRATQASGTSGPSGATPGGSGPERETPPGWASGTAPGAAPGASPGAAPGASAGTTPGASAGTMPGASLGAALGASAGTLPGSLLGTALGASLGGPLGMVPPGLLLATGQVLPVSSVHRLARTSTLVRIVMNADGQVLDMGRKVRLATPAQRRAIFARYATCWVDGCPLPATMCQIDHADNWSTGGLTDLKLLGPACQFHNRDRYQHPDRYTRRNVGEDRWAFTYHRLGRARRLHE